MARPLSYFLAALALFLSGSPFSQATIVPPGWSPDWFQFSTVDTVTGEEAHVDSGDVDGVWTGLLQGDSFQSTGRARMVLNRFAVGSLSVRLGNEPDEAVKISIQPDGTLIQRHATPAVGAALRLIVRDRVRMIVGDVTAAGQTTPVVLVRAEAPWNNAAVAGAYTVAFANTTPTAALPVGVAGGGLVRIGRQGSVQFLARLADGTLFAQGAQLDSTGHWQLSARNAHGALLSGRVEFSDQTNSDCTGALTLHADGSATVPALSLVGSRYDSRRGFGDAAAWSLEASTQATGAAASSRSLQSISPAGPLVRESAPRARVRLIRATGAIRGSFVHEGDGQLYTFSGVVFQKTNSGAGNTRRGDRPTGTFTLSAQAGSGATSAGTIRIGSGTLVLAGGGIYTGGTLAVMPGALVLQGGTLNAATGTAIQGGTLTLAPGFMLNPLQPPLNLTGGTLTTTLPTGGTLGGSLTFTGSSVIMMAAWNSAGEGPGMGVERPNFVVPATFTGTLRLTNTATPIASWHFEQIGDAATLTFAGSTMSYSGLAFKALVHEARARGEETLVFGSVTLSLAPRP